MSPPRERGAPVVLVHGLFLGGWSMRRLARRLADRGFRPHCFDYDTVAQGPLPNARALLRCLRRRAAPKVHVVAHSMGGLLLRHALALDGDVPIDRCAMLGTPNRGSAVARRLAAWPGFARMIANGMRHGLDGDAPPWPRGVELGIVAGSRPLGAGIVITRLAAPHDGTVAVEETALDGFAARWVLPETHTGMLRSRAVAEVVAEFLGRE